jgi:ATP-dependent RNA helicase DDX35
MNLIKQYHSHLNNRKNSKRSNLACPILQLKALGVENTVRFEFVSPPSPKLISHGLELLYSLKAVDDYGRLTIPIGVNISEAPLDPMISSMVRAKGEEGTFLHSFTHFIHPFIDTF